MRLGFRVGTVDRFGGSVGPSGGDAEMRPFWGKRGSGKIARRNEVGRIVGGKGNFVTVGELSQIASESGERVVGARQTQQDAAARFAARRAMHTFHAGHSAAGKQATDVQHFVERIRVQDALQAARAGSLLDDEGDGKRSLNLGQVDVAQKIDQCSGTELVAYRCPSDFRAAEVKQAAVDGDGAKNIHARGARLCGRGRADIDEHVFDVA